MKKIYFLSLLTIASVAAKAQAAFCDTMANIIIYSNYDGGTLNINVDKNIPNLKIGVVTYEAAKITISGPYVNNVTAVRYAGYIGTNDNCAQGVTNTTIAGVPANIDTIIQYPAAGYSNSNGYPFIICNYSCSSTTNQGGCNTPDQIVYYFTNAFGGTLNYHHTQYNCWLPTNTYSVSAGGNCCIMPTSSVANVLASKKTHVFPNPATNELNCVFSDAGLEHSVQLINLLGSEVKTLQSPAGAERARIDVSGLPKGIYCLVIKEGKHKYFEKVVVE